MGDYDAEIEKGLAALSGADTAEERKTIATALLHLGAQVIAATDDKAERARIAGVIDRARRTG